MTTLDTATRPDLERSVLAEVTTMIHDVVGQEYADDLDITMDTTFQDDIDLESIEFVALADKIRLSYGSSVDLVGFLATMDVDDVIALSVGDVVRLIADGVSGISGISHPADAARG